MRVHIPGSFHFSIQLQIDMCVPRPDDADGKLVDMPNPVRLKAVCHTPIEFLPLSNHDHRRIVCDQFRTRGALDTGSDPGHVCFGGAILPVAAAFHGDQLIGVFRVVDRESENPVISEIKRQVRNTRAKAFTVPEAAHARASQKAVRRLHLDNLRVII